MDIPELNKIYNHFDDGKIRKSRMSKVFIKEIIPFHEINLDTKKVWGNDVYCCPWLYNRETDYFIVGKLENDEKDHIYVRTTDNGWFSLGVWGGRLDIDGSLTKNIDSNGLQNNISPTFRL